LGELISLSNYFTAFSEFSKQAKALSIHSVMGGSGSSKCVIAFEKDNPEVFSQQLRLFLYDIGPFVADVSHTIQRQKHKVLLGQIFGYTAVEDQPPRTIGIFFEHEMKASKTPSSAGFSLHGAG